MLILGDAARPEQTISRIKELRRLAAGLGIEGEVDLLGFIPNPYAFMARAALLALSSTYEGLPTVLIEAMACGCPVVSTNCPSGPAEILAGGRYGPLVPVGDDAALAAAMEHAWIALSTQQSCARAQPIHRRPRDGRVSQRPLWFVT